MTFAEAMLCAADGGRVTRPAFGDDFIRMQGNRLLRCRFMGETSFASAQPFRLSDQDKTASDWRLFSRVLPDAWEGCDAPMPPKGSAPEKG